MPTKKRHREALASLGVEPVDYHIGGWPPIWGTAYQRNGKDLFVIETHGSHTDDDALRNKYIAKSVRGATRKRQILGVFKLKRQALAWMMRVNR